jgi:thioesterase domain-containing protein
LVAALIPIWEKVLDRPFVDIHENFFDMGGDPWRAVELFYEIGIVTKRKLAPMLIYAAPTIAELSCLLEDAETPRLPPVQLLKAGTNATPVSFIHGLGGNIMEFFQVVRHVKSSNAIYGLQARGTDGLEEPCSSVEEIAQFHLEALRVQCPKGPYAFVGYSLGGLVAMEIGRRLVAVGECVRSLVMIDSYPPIRYAPVAQRLRAYGRKTARYMTERKPSRVSRTADVNNSLGVPYTPAMLRVEQAAVRALRQYHPRPYNGNVGFIRAGTPLKFPDDPKKVWAKFIERFEVETVPGDHHEILTKNYEHLATVISRLLKDLTVEPPTGRLSQ